MPGKDVRSSAAQTARPPRGRAAFERTGEPVLGPLAQIGLLARYFEAPVRLDMAAGGIRDGGPARGRGPPIEALHSRPQPGSATRRPVESEVEELMQDAGLSCRRCAATRTLVGSMRWAITSRTSRSATRCSCTADDLRLLTVSSVTTLGVDDEKAWETAAPSPEMATAVPDLENFADPARLPAAFVETVTSAPAETAPVQL
jgi:hypothetical protein